MNIALETSQRCQQDNCKCVACPAVIIRAVSCPMTEPSTPLMRQYAAIKKEHPNALLFFRLGDFYELFFEDAVVAARELQITLTSRNKEKGIAIPMCGVPTTRLKLHREAHPQGL